MLESLNYSFRNPKNIIWVIYHIKQLRNYKKKKKMGSSEDPSLINNVDELGLVYYGLTTMLMSQWGGELKGDWWVTNKDRIFKEIVLVWLTKCPGRRGRMEEEHEMTLPAARPGFEPRTYWIPDYRPRHEVRFFAQHADWLCTPLNHTKGCQRQSGGQEATFSVKVVLSLRMRGALPPFWVLTASLLFNPLTALGYFNIQHSTFSPHTVCICFLRISEQTAIISVCSINWLVCITETECVYCAVRTGDLNVIQLNFSVQRVSKLYPLSLIHAQRWRGNSICCYGVALVNICIACFNIK